MIHAMPPAKWNVSSLSLPAENDVHVWRIKLTEVQLESGLNLLNAEEQERAAKFYFSRDKKRFIVSRSLLRALIGAYLNQAPASLRFQLTPHGKPFLTDTLPLSFNLSHANEFVYFAFSCTFPLGIDVEFLPRRTRLRAVARRFFAQSEYAAWSALPADLQRPGFFACWTRKEAIVKAHGDGISLGLNRFVVSVTPNEPARLLSMAPQVGRLQDWQLQDLQSAPEYHGAIAVRTTKKIHIRYLA